MPTTNLQILKTSGDVAYEAALRFKALAQKSILDHDYFSVVLAGGLTPKKMYSLLATTQFKEQIDWKKVFVFWGDERLVPLSDSESNYKLAWDSLLSQVPIPKKNIFAVGFTDDAIQAAQIYEQKIKTFFKNNVVFDVVFLGIGPDGHTASLFPNFPEVTNPSENLVTAIFNSPKPPPTRVTLTFKALNSSKEIFFLVTGAEKANAVKSILEGPLNPGLYPAQGIKSVYGSTTWLIEEDASKMLNSPESLSKAK